jgi:hypothetical protein
MNQEVAEICAHGPVSQTVSYWREVFGAGCNPVVTVPLSILIDASPATLTVQEGKSATFSVIIARLGGGPTDGIQMQLEAACITCAALSYATNAKIAALGSSITPTSGTIGQDNPAIRATVTITTIPQSVASWTDYQIASFCGPNLTVSQCQQKIMQTYAAQPGTYPLMVACYPAGLAKIPQGDIATVTVQVTPA